jgi:AcrR family transcriptional regulator
MVESDAASGISGSDDDLTWRIVEAAVEQAEEVGWENVRLRLVAERLGVPLDEIGSRVRDLDGVADAWFTHAWKAMQQPLSPEMATLPTRDRLEAVLWRWFESLSAHRRVTVQMLKTKLWPFHPHHWVPLPFNLSRTILWLRDASGCDDASPRREVEEVGLTWLFLATLAVWSRDDSDNQQRTRRFLRRRLADASSLMTLLFGAQSSTRATP